MNTCRFTIDHHPDTDQCGEDMITHAVHVEPINIDAPQWVLEAATRHMCNDLVTEHEHFLPHIGPVIPVMAAKGLDTVVILAPDYWDIEDACRSGDTIGVIGARLCRVERPLRRPREHTAAVIDLAAGTVTATTRKAAWTAL